MSEIRYAYRRPPCPAYDVEGMESWLGDMSAQGLRLSTQGFFLGFAMFEKGEPAAQRYRLAPRPQAKPFWKEDSGQALAPEAQALYEALGWDFVAPWGNAYHIFRARDEGVPELDTDPQVQAIAMAQARKRQREAVAACVVYVLLTVLLQLRGNLLLTTLALGSGLTALCLGLVVWLLVHALVSAVQVGRLYRKLQAGVPLNHAKNWQSKALGHHLGNGLVLVLGLCCLVLLAVRWGSLRQVEAGTPLSDYAQPTPFATLADFAEGTYQPSENAVRSNRVIAASDLLAPVILDYAESATVTLEDGSLLDGILYVDYYETLTPFLARELARECCRQDRRSFGLEELPLPELGVDWAMAYTNSIHFPTLVLQNGCQVVKATFYQFSEGTRLALEDWAQIMADSLG